MADWNDAHPPAAIMPAVACPAEITSHAFGAARRFQLGFRMVEQLPDGSRRQWVLELASFFGRLLPPGGGVAGKLIGDHQARWAHLIIR